MLEGRAVIVRRLRALPLEAVVRGYLIGSGWKDYQRSGRSAASLCRADCGRPSGCPTPIFTPGNQGRAGRTR